MANSMDLGRPGGGNFKPVTVSYDIVSGARAKSEGGIVHPSGRTPLNVNATARLDRLATEAGVSIERYNLAYEADDLNRIVHAWIATEVRPGVLPIRRHKKDRTVTIHLGGVFKQFPSMRPTGKRSCTVSLGQNTKGRPCLVIALGTGLGTRTTSRSDGEAATEA